METGDLVHSDNGMRWRLVQTMADGFWLAHAVTDKAAHIRGISAPLHIISEKYLTKSRIKRNDEI